MKNLTGGKVLDRVCKCLTCTRFFTTHIFSPAINRGVI